MRRFSVAIILAGALLSIPALAESPALYFSQALPPPITGDYGLWGHRLASAGDVNGDGFGDFLATGALPDGTSFNAYAYLYFGGVEGLGPTPTEVFKAQSYFPEAVYAVGAGDVDGDGYDDILVSDPFINFPSWNNKIYLFRGGPDGISSSPAWEYSPRGSNGANLSRAGDLNGDGFGDVVISDAIPDAVEWWWSNSGALVFYGSSSGLGSEPDVSIIRPQPNLYFGNAFLPIGDVNGDGLDDLVVYSERGSWAWDDPQGYFLHLYLGSTTGVATSPAWEAAEWDAMNFPTIGASLAAGDFNGDGKPDLAAGGYHAAMSENLAGGGAFVWYGDGASFGEEYGWSFYSDWQNSWFGEAVAAGDVNGDGFDDLLVIAPQYGMGLGDEGNEEPVGRIFAFYGSPTGLSPAPDFVAGSNDYSFTGHALVNAGDLNGDGNDDFAATVFTNDSEESVLGVAEIAYGQKKPNLRGAGIGPLCFVEAVFER